MYKILLKRPRLIQWFFLLAVLFFLSPMGFGVAQEPKTGQEPLKYESSVSVQLMPLYAVDKAGNPVFDLKPEEMELFVDGKPMPIIFFEGYHPDVQKPTPAARPDPSPMQARTPERLNFIILDTMISNMSILGPAQVVAAEIIKQASPGDAYIILESNGVTGLQYILGPTKNQEELLEGLAGIKKRYEKRVMLDTGMREMAEKGIKMDEVATIYAMTQERESAEKKMYQRDVRRFANGLMQLKYALKSTSLPKTVFLISAQSRTDELDENQANYLNLLEEAAKSVNYGGSLFYLINPLGQKKRGQGAELQFMADAAGGKFISGSGTQDILAQVKNNTSAYYEMAFNSTSKEGQKNAIKINCKRKGVSLITINYSEQERSYARMNDTERKMFLLNIVNGGDWSRMTMPIKRVGYKSLDSSPEQNNIIKNIELTIPLEMQNKKFHLYQMAVDEATQMAELTATEKTVLAKEHIAFNKKEGKNNYFILIDSAGTTCFYNRVN